MRERPPTVLRPSRRPAGAGDAAFLSVLFAGSRPELAGLPVALVQLQERAQRAQYRAAFPHGLEQVISTDRPVGRCWVARSEPAHHLVDLSLLGEFRNLGIGSLVLGELAAEAAAAGKPLRLQVWHANAAAVRLYRRFGFGVDSDRNGYLAMSLPAPDGPPVMPR
jgi:ribosomal protein S18 acetylase RimI-like enzyme